MLFMNLVVAFLLGFLAAEVFTLIRWRGLWRLASLLPLFAVGFIIMRIAIDPQMHYLLPIEILITSFGGLCFLGLLAGIQWLIKVIRQRRRVE